mmetsp:Transcript_33660/g.51963  ORF Transcript_33660/g.51963 Transcript_33660/m.51963 type:complete len:204 (-) Transcript_33660:5923-6534(-)
MTGIGTARVDCDASEPVFEAVLNLGLDVVFVLFALLLLFLLVLYGLLVFVGLAVLGFLGLVESLFLVHDFPVGIRLEVEHLRELEQVVQLIILERVEVEHDSLEVDDQHVGRVRNQGALVNIHLLLTAGALVVIDDFSGDKFSEAVLHRFDAFDGERQIQEVLNTVLHFTALIADQLAASGATEDRSQQVLSRGVLQSLLDSV